MSMRPTPAELLKWRETPNYREARLLAEVDAQAERITELLEAVRTSAMSLRNARCSCKTTGDDLKQPVYPVKAWALIEAAKHA